MRQIVVNRLRHTNTRNREPQRRADLRHLEGGVHRVVATVVKEIADVVSAEDLDQPLVLGAVLIDALELEARRAESPRRRVHQSPDRCGAFAGEIDEVLGERADDSVPAGVKLAYVPRMLHRGLDYAAGRCIDDGGNTAGLSVERVLSHGSGGRFSGRIPGRAGGRSAGFFLHGETAAWDWGGPQEYRSRRGFALMRRRIGFDLLRGRR